MPTVLLVRHGRTTANATGLLAGWSEGVALDEAGIAQARSVGERLAGAALSVASVVASPLLRCQQTAASIAAAADGLVPEATVDERLGECRYGAWTGRSLSDLAGEPLWRVVQDHPSSARFPDGDLPGESIPQMSARAVTAIRDHDARVAAEHGNHAVWIAVSHGDVIKAILADALGMHLDLFQRLHVDPASVSAVRYTSQRPMVLRINDSGSDLAALRPAQDRADDGDAAVGGGSGGAEPAAGPG